MGQRLNIEIINDGKTLANAYYHWSGYSTTAINMAADIVHNIPIESKIDPLRLAIALLQNTGAGISKEEKEKAIEQYPKLNDFIFKKCTDRNDGIISVSKEGIKETRMWQEGQVYIYLDESRISFKCYYDEDQWDWEENNEGQKAKDLAEYDVNFDDVKFRDIDAFAKFVDDHKDEYFRLETDRWKVVSMIY